MNTGNYSSTAVDYLRKEPGVGQDWARKRPGVTARSSSDSTKGRINGRTNRDELRRREATGQGCLVRLPGCYLVESGAEEGTRTLTLLS